MKKMWGEKKEKDKTKKNKQEKKHVMQRKLQYFPLPFSVLVNKHTRNYYCSA